MDGLRTIVELTKGAGALLAFSYVISWSNKVVLQSLTQKSIFQGCLYGLAAIIGMAFPLQLADGIIFDARTVVLSVASAVGGPIVAIVSALLAGFYRLYLGGGGALIGFATIVVSSAIGFGYWSLFTNKGKDPKLIIMFSFGFIVHFFVISWFFLLPMSWSDTFTTIALPMLTTFTPATAILLKIITGDEHLILAIRAKEEADDARDEATKNYSQTLLDTIKAIALTIEKRDPYTSGHQTRVSNLAVEIGKKLNWDMQRLEGLRLGALIHDLGKIYIPAEILNRPGKVSENEMSLIKEHPQIGYKIISDVKFPWPVAKMILQHHERLDGSGYPSGLIGDDIIDEAKVLAVADVVEAITSHRPYRAALGIEKGIDELNRGRGIIYDAKIVDACIELITKDGFNPVPN